MAIVVRGANVNAYATIPHLGYVFQLTRPVEPDGQRRRSGWMLSVEGHAMVLIADCDIKKAKEFCRLKLGKCKSRDEMQAAIAQTISDQAVSGFTDLEPRNPS